MHVVKKALPYLIGIGELQRQASSVIKKVDAMRGEGFIVSHNEPRAVLMSLQRYEILRLLEENRRMEEADVLAIVEAGDDEFSTGKTNKSMILKDYISK